MPQNDKHLSYKQAGVNIDAGNALVNIIKPLAKATARKGADCKIGSYGGVFDLKATGYKDPLLVATNDGVGTKVKIASEMANFTTVGIDCVAMCVNDLIVQGAEPLFFLDYYATGQLRLDDASALIASITEGCKQSGCALIGGETAEMPGLYHGRDIDIAGFAVGAVERNALITGEHIKEGHMILGLASDGIHSNGFSLVRKIIDLAGLKFEDEAPFAPNTALGTAILMPTRIYVKSCLAAIRAGGVDGLAHITGGGLIDNLPRVLPEGLCAMIDAQSWPVPPVFQWLQKTGNIKAEEMLRTFNCGIGMVVIVPEQRADALTKVFSEAGETVHRIGHIAPMTKGRDFVNFTNLSRDWPL